MTQSREPRAGPSPEVRLTRRTVGDRRDGNADIARVGMGAIGTVVGVYLIATLPTGHYLYFASIVVLAGSGLLMLIGLARFLRRSADR